MYTRFENHSPSDLAPIEIVQEVSVNHVGGPGLKRCVGRIHSGAGCGLQGLRQGWQGWKRCLIACRGRRNGAWKVLRRLIAFFAVAGWDWEWGVEDVVEGVVDIEVEVEGSISAGRKSMAN